MLPFRHTAFFFRLGAVGIILVAMLATRLPSVAAAPLGQNPIPPGPVDCSTLLGFLGFLPEVGFQQREQDVFPTRTTGVAHFYNFTDKEYTFRISDKWQSLHAGSRFRPYETWVELPPGEYDYAAYYDGGVIYGHTNVFQTITWPVAIGQPYQEPEPPRPVGKYAPPSPTRSTLVLRNASDFELTLVVLGKAYNLHAGGDGTKPEIVIFLPPGKVDIQIFADPGGRELAERYGCGDAYDTVVKTGALLTREVRLRQVTLLEFPK